MINKNKIMSILVVFIIFFSLSFFNIAEGSTIRVKPNDSLYLLAIRYKTSIQAIKSVNNLTSDRIYANDTLTIPTLNSRKANFKSIVWPVHGRISSGYGYRTHPIRGTRHMHAGIDIAVPRGTSIRAVSNGKVVLSGWVQGFGNTIVIDHENGYKTLYAHNSKLLVHSGSRVNKSQKIALAGSSGQSTGPHLDFRIYLNGKEVNPMNYLP